MHFKSCLLKFGSSRGLARFLIPRVNYIKFNSVNFGCTGAARKRLARGCVRMAGREGRGGGVNGGDLVG